MMGYIQGQAPNADGKWNIADVPGGGGNWGGSFLTVTKQSQHQKEAAALVKFLTSPKSELYVFKHTGNLPSEVPLLKSKAVRNFRNPYFNNAPVGKIFANSALKLKPQPLGPHQGDFQTASTNAIQRVEQHLQSPKAAWQQFLKDAANVRLSNPPSAGPGRGRHPRRPRPGLRRSRGAAHERGIRNRKSRRGRAAPRARRNLLRRLDAKLSPYLFVAPFFLLFGVFGLFPLGYTAYISLTDRNLLAPVSHFIGLHNYALLLHDSYFWNAVENTFGDLVPAATVPQLLLALVIAHVLNTKLHARTFFRMAVLLPQVTSLVAVALIFTQLFAHDYGFVNYVLGKFGVHHDLLGGRPLLVVGRDLDDGDWRWTGYNALIYLAAMQAIPRELYEAARVDGARRFRQFRT